jgi:uncharacterized protein (UPF0332 family)
MKPATKKLLVKAAHAIHSAELLLEAKEIDFAAGRAYYAMFYVASALLNEKGLRFRKHGGVHAAFGEHFAKPRLMDPKFHRWLLDAFGRRLQGDYDFEAALEAEEVSGMIRQAKEFKAEAEKYLQGSSQK